jgi:hypothetical protein
MDSKRSFVAGFLAGLFLFASIARAEPAITVFEVSSSKMRAVLKKHHYRDFRAVGFTVLGKTASGQEVCYVYLLDAGDAETLEHELRHCQGWSHR